MSPLLLVIAAVVVPALSQTRLADAAPPGTGADPAIRQEITGVGLTDNYYLTLENT